MATYMTPREVAERWSCSAAHVRRLCRDGKLPAMRLGLDAWRISVAAVESYEAAQSTGSVFALSAETPNQEPSRSREVRPATAAAGFSLPADYEPVFPELWGQTASTKKASLNSH